uniref:Uncharacterized protein n=1 Tax=Anguilla anguilla TaxID=7936 RepID=A0A0E9UXP8_ANGAN
MRTPSGKLTTGFWGGLFSYCSFSLISPVTHL